ncbi:MAG: SDR family NAD(P)-dependent oxidoreductase [Opitutaceae bacterium]
MNQQPRVVLITGASAGIGRATARASAQEGARIGLFARGLDGLEAARREVEDLWEPVPGDYGAHAAFDGKAQASSVQWELSKRRERIGVAALALGVIAGAIASRPGQRREPRRRVAPTAPQPAFAER